MIVRSILSTVLVLLALLLLPSLSACPVAHEEVSPQACRDDRDCFFNEGEFCEQSSGTCKLRLDGAPDATHDTSHDTTYDTTDDIVLDVLPDSDAIFDGDALTDGDEAGTDMNGAADASQQQDVNNDA